MTQREATERERAVWGDPAAAGRLSTGCAFCGGVLARHHSVAEMMLGTREKFLYGECANCGSLQLVDVPTDLSKYYPTDYYSLQPRPAPRLHVRFAKRLRAEAAVRGHDRIARAVGLGVDPPQWPKWLEQAGVDRTAEICDIGCGNGDLLINLKTQGFRNLTGADAFISRSSVRNGIPLHKGGPADVPGTFDFVMLNHSFEHMPDPAGQLQALRRLLRPGATLMLRVPVAGCEAWRTYGTHWVAIDAPRHLTVPSERGLTDLVERCGYKLDSVVYDSTGMQYWRSEQYAQDIPLFDPRSYQVDRRASQFTKKQIADWERRAREANSRGDGDTAAFFLRVAEEGVNTR